MGKEKEEECVGESAAPSGDEMKSAAEDKDKDKELANVRRQRGHKKASVTRIRKTLEQEIARHASRDRIQEVLGRLKEAFAQLRKAHQLYEGLVDDEETVAVQEYADSLENEEFEICGKVQVYLQHLQEVESVAASSRRARSRGISCASGATAASIRSREAVIELEDADRKLSDIKAQLEEERRNRMERQEQEKRRQQESGRWMSGTVL